MSVARIARLRCALVIAVVAIPAISASDDSHARLTPRCTALARTFRRLWQSAPRTCAVDTDCSCYPTDVERFCAQDAVDARTLHALESVRACYVTAQCRNLASFCNPYHCSAACVQGRCASRP